jgi:hypothetical protein
MIFIIKKYMKNILNEELNTMKYLFDYKKGMVISEQANSTTTVDLNTHRTNCLKTLQLINRNFTFSDARGLRKETISLKVTDIVFTMAQKGNILQHKQNVAARSSQDVAIVTGSLPSGGEFKFTLSCQKQGRFTLTQSGNEKGGIRVNDIYECPQLWNVLYNSMYVCGRVKEFKGDGKDYCKI